MKRNILKLLSLVLVVALLASLAACKPKDKDKDKNKKPNNSVSADVEQGDDGDLSNGGDIDEAPGRKIIVSLAATDGKISSGIKLDYDGDDFSDFGEDILDEDLGDLKLVSSSISAKSYRNGVQYAMGKDCTNLIDEDLNTKVEFMQNGTGTHNWAFYDNGVGGIKFKEGGVDVDVTVNFTIELQPKSIVKKLVS